MAPLDVSPARWLDTPPSIEDDSLVVITEALLPVFDWLDVPVIRAVEQKLSVVERFLIESALVLGDLSPEDVEEITGLPEEATRRITGHLCETGVLEARDEGYVPDEEAALATLKRESLVELRQDVLTFIVLPRSGDALAFEHKKGRAAPPKIHRLDPAASAPVPDTYRDATQTSVLRGLIDARRVSGLPEDIVEVPKPEDDKPITDTCPVYRYTGRLRLRSGQMKASGHVYGESGEERVSVDLSRASGLIDYWLSQAELLHLAEIFQAACYEIGCSPSDAEVRRSGASQWAFQVNSVGARDIAERGRRLCRPAGLELVSPDRTTKIEVVASFKPAGPDAEALFAVDAAADTLEELPPDSLEPADLSKAISVGRAAYHVEESLEMASAVRERLWARGRQYLVYRLRANEDFDYD